MGFLNAGWQALNYQKSDIQTLVIAVISVGYQQVSTCSHLSAE